MNTANPEVPFVGCSYYNLLSSGEKTETVFINAEFNLKQFKQRNIIRWIKGSFYQCLGSKVFNKLYQKISIKI